MIDAKRARVGVSVVFAVCGASFATWTARVPAAQQRLGLSTGQLAIALFVLATGSILMLVVTGAVIARIGSRSGAVAGVATLSGGLVLVASAPDMVLFCAALFVLGAGNSLLDVSMNAHAARVETAYGRPIFAGFHAFWNIGGLFGSGLAALLAQARVPIGYHFPAMAAAMFGVGLSAIVVLFLRTPDADRQGPAFVLPSRVLLPLGVIAFCGFLAEGTVNDWSAVYLSKESVTPGGVSSLGYFAFSVAMILVRLVADRMAARFGAPGVMRAAAVVATIGFLVVAWLTVPAVGVLGFGIVGLGLAAVVPLAWSAAARMSPDAPGQAISAVAACGYLGFLTGPAVVGAIASTVGLRVALPCVIVFVATTYALASRTRTVESSSARPA